MLYYYSPLLTWLFRPLTWFSYQSAVVIWAGLTSVVWALAVWLATKLPWRGQAPASASHVGLVILLPYRFVLNHQLHGQVDIIILLLTLVSCGSLVRGWYRACGVALGFAVVLKPTPVLLLGYLAVKREWAAIKWTLLAIAVFLLLPVSGYGVNRFAELVHMWWSGPLREQALSLATDAQESNQSLAATIYRYCLPKPLEPPEDAAPALVRLSEGQVWVIIMVCSLLVACLAVSVIWRSGPGERDHWFGFALTLVVAHLILKRTWGYHLVSMVFVYAVILGEASKRNVRAASRNRLLLCVFVAALLQNLGSPLILGKRLSSVFSSYGPVTLSLLVLMLGLASVLSDDECQGNGAA